MSTAPEKSIQDLLTELNELSAKYEDAEATLAAIRSGSVDALVVRGKVGDQVFTLRGVDEPYRVFVEEMCEGAVTLDEVGTILYCNRAFAGMAGEPLEKVIGASLSQYFPEIWEHCSSCDDLAGLGRIETTFVSEASKLAVLCSFASISTEGPAAIALTVTDLTEQREQNVRLAKATEELEGFCYSVSHDMRAPIRAMMGNAKIVIEDYGEFLPESAKIDLEQIATSAGHLGRLMDDLLAYSGLARQDIAGQVVDLSELAGKIAENLESTGYPNIVWLIEPGLRAHGDPRLLEMALRNLLANAAKFSSRREQAEIRFGLDSDQGAFFVADNGIGFDMRYVEKLFMPFERLHRQEDYEGTGIGLANVKRIITRHGGKIWADGEVGHHAIFFFTLS